MPIAIPRTLAQLGNFINPDIPALPDPPPLERYLLEQPLVPVVVLLLAGIVAVFALRNAGKPKAGVLALVAAALAASCVVLTATMVTTSREDLLARQDTLVGAVADAEIDTLDRLLSPDARMPPVRIPMLSGGLSRERILSTVASTTGGAYPVGDFGIVERQAVIDGANAARTQIHVRVEPENAGGTFVWFQIAWRLDPQEGWRAVEIEPLFMSGVLPYNQ